MQNYLKDGNYYIPKDYGGLKSNAARTSNASEAALFCIRPTIRTATDRNIWSNATVLGQWEYDPNGCSVQAVSKEDAKQDVIISYAHPDTEETLRFLQLGIIIDGLGTNSALSNVKAKTEADRIAIGFQSQSGFFNFSLYEVKKGLADNLYGQAVEAEQHLRNTSNVFSRPAINNTNKLENEFSFMESGKNQSKYYTMLINDSAQMSFSAPLYAGSPANLLVKDFNKYAKYNSGSTMVKIGNSWHDSNKMGIKFTGELAATTNSNNKQNVPLQADYNTYIDLDLGKSVQKVVFGLMSSDWEYCAPYKGTFQVRATEDDEWTDLCDYYNLQVGQDANWFNRHGGYRAQFYTFLDFGKPCRYLRVNIADTYQSIDMRGNNTRKLYMRLNNLQVFEPTIDEAASASLKAKAAAQISALQEAIATAKAKAATGVVDSTDFAALQKAIDNYDLVAAPTNYDNLAQQILSAGEIIEPAINGTLGGYNDDAAYSDLQAIYAKTATPLELLAAEPNPTATMTVAADADKVAANSDAIRALLGNRVSSTEAATYADQLTSLVKRVQGKLIPITNIESGKIYQIVSTGCLHNDHVTFQPAQGYGRDYGVDKRGIRGNVVYAKTLDAVSGIAYNSAPESPLRAGCGRATTDDDDNAASMWLITKNGDTGYNLQNLATGYYLDMEVQASENGAQTAADGTKYTKGMSRLVTSTEPKLHWTFNYLNNNQPSFILIYPTEFKSEALWQDFGNTNKTYDEQTKSVGLKCWTKQTVSQGGTFVVREVATPKDIRSMAEGLSIVTLPYNSAGPVAISDGATAQAYEVVDLVKPYSPLPSGAGVITHVVAAPITGTIAAGTPFILSVSKSASAKRSRRVSAAAGQVLVNMNPQTADLGLNAAAATTGNNGLHASIASSVLTGGDGLAYIDDNGEIAAVSAGKSQGIGAQSGYINASEIAPKSYDESLSIAIPVSESGQLVGIQKAAQASASGTVNVYTTDGVLLRKGAHADSATRGLPKGLYIIGKQKVLVK